MNAVSFANTTLFLLGVVCTILAMRALYVYTLSRSTMLFIIGVAIGTIGLAIFCGFAENVHLTTYNTQWAWYVGSSIGACFLVISSLVKSNAQLQRVRHWQMVASGAFLLVVLITPTLPAFSSPFIPATFNIFRTLIYCVGFIRYATLSSSKGTRFTLLMSAGFLLIGVGFGIFTPQIFQPSLAVLSIIGSTMRMLGYTTLLLAYTVG